jgi:hypothetical protein
VPRVVRATDSTGLLVGAVGIENNNDRNFKDSRGMLGSAKLLKNSPRERKGILIAPLKRLRFFTVTESLSSWTFTCCLKRNVGFRPKSRGTDGKPISPTWRRWMIPNQHQQSSLLALFRESLRACLGGGPTNSNDKAHTFSITAAPVAPGVTGQRYSFTDQSGLIRADQGQAATS